MHINLRLALIAMAFLPGACLDPHAQPQTPPNESWTDRTQRMSREAETRGLAEPFRGITTNGTVRCS